MAFRSDAYAQFRLDGIHQTKPTVNWRCVRCGQVFSADNLRKGARTRALIDEQTQT